MSLLSKRKPEELKGVRNFFKIVSLPSWPRALQSVPIVLVCAIHRLIRFVYSILIPFVGSSLPPFRVLLRHQLKVSQFAVERIYIDYNVKIRQIDKIDKSILMAIQQRKIYIFHQGPGWSSVFPMLSSLIVLRCFQLVSDLRINIEKAGYGSCHRFVTQQVNMSWLGSTLLLASWTLNAAQSA